MVDFQHRNAGKAAFSSVVAMLLSKNPDFMELLRSFADCSFPPPAFSGPTSQGIELLVPEPAEEDAREILDSLGTADGDEWDEEWESE